MIKVGLTGGIGSGKTIVGKLFVMNGIPVFSADDEAKILLDFNPVIREKLTSVFGSDIYLQNHTIDRKKFASLIFNNESLLQKANEIIHPEVRKCFIEWCSQQDAPFVIYEAAILFESGHSIDMDYNILVVADESVRIKRVMDRNQFTEEQVRQRIDKQWHDKRKIELADFVIKNNNEELIIPQVIEIIEKIKTHG